MNINITRDEIIGTLQSEVQDKDKLIAFLQDNVHICGDTIDKKNKEAQELKARIEVLKQTQGIWEVVAKDNKNQYEKLQKENEELKDKILEKVKDIISLGYDVVELKKENKELRKLIKYSKDEIDDISSEIEYNKDKELLKCLEKADKKR